MPHPREVAREPAFAATELERPPPGIRHAGKELVTMEHPIAVVVGLARPRDPRGRVALPFRPQIGARAPDANEPGTLLAHQAPYPVMRRRVSRSARNRSSGISGDPSSGNGNGHPGRGSSAYRGTTCAWRCGTSLP